MSKLKAINHNGVLVFPNDLPIPDFANVLMSGAGTYTATEPCVIVCGKGAVTLRGVALNSALCGQFFMNKGDTATVHANSIIYGLAYPRGE